MNNLKGRIKNYDEPYTVRLWVFEECKDVPKITLPNLFFRTLEDYKKQCYTDGTEKIVSDKKEGDT